MCILWVHFFILENDFKHPRLHGTTIYLRYNAYYDPSLCLITEGWRYTGFIRHVPYIMRNFQTLYRIQDPGIGLERDDSWSVDWLNHAQKQHRIITLIITRNWNTFCSAWVKYLSNDFTFWNYIQIMAVWRFYIG